MFKDQVVLVTGASRGIGQAIALEFGKQGAVVAGTATTDAGATRITDYLKAAGLRGRGFMLNVTDSASIETAWTAIQAQVGVPAIVVNNAGITRDNLMLRMKLEEWSEVINTNLSGLYRLTKVCLKSMIKARFGRIINISSVVGVTGNAGQANYAAAKAGLIGFSKSLAQEVASRNITVNVVAPGFIDTDMTQVLTEEQRQSLLRMIPLQRIGTPQDVAYAVVFLASEQANYITGVVLQVNGGMYMG